MGLFPAKEGAHQLLDFGNTRRAADHDHFLNIVRRKLGVFQRLLDRLHGAFQQVAHQLFQACARQLQLHVNWSAGARGDEGQVNLRLHHLGQLDLGLFRGVLQALQRHAVFAQVDVVLFFEFVDEPVDNPLVNVIASQVGIAVCGLDFHHARADFQHRNIKGAATEVVDGNGFVTLLIQAVRQRRRGRFINNAHHVEPGNFTGLLGGLPLRVVEVRRHGDDRLGNFLAKKIFGCRLQFAENHRRDLRRAIQLSGNVHAGVVVLAFDHFVRNALGLFVYFVEAPAHESLDRIHGVFWIGDRLPLGYLSHQTLAGLGDGHNRRRGAGTLLIRYHYRFSTLHYRYYRVRSAQIDSDNLTHNARSSLDQILICRK